ncbi:4Fe-4S binding protein [bacterium]|nr:4Fe-4S binding protein [bacterium]
MQIRPPEVAVPHTDLAYLKRVALAGITIGLFFLLLALTGMSREHPLLFLLLSAGLTSAGALIYFLAQLKETTPGIKNNHLFENPLTSRGWIAWPIALFLTLFYVSLYWFPEWIENWVRMVDPVSFLMTGRKADRWFLYGTFYTLSVLVMGMRIILVKYRHNRYHIIRTASVMFFQLGFAFLIPNLLRRLNQPDFYFSYFWPLKYEYLFPGSVEGLLKHPGGLGFFMVFWGAMMTFVAIPVLTYFFGKRWYCSWVCGCGGLAETLGDPFRHLSDKSLKAWKIERWMVHSVLLFIVITTGLLWFNSISEGGILKGFSSKMAKGYGFFIGAIFSGVIGVGFYPLMGQRVWCRFGCPLAATLGIIQKFFSRFRISTNGGQCMSCGNCSTYCEMGIDVRWYAQRGQNIIRASCVGCGVCAAVCPRGVLKLENGPQEGRYNLKSPTTQ